MEKPTAKAAGAAFRKIDRAIAAGKKCRTISRIFPPKAGQQIIVPVKYQKVRQFAHPCAILLCVSVSTRVSLLTSKPRSCPIGQGLREKTRDLLP